MKATSVLKVSVLKKKYPDFFSSVESSTWEYMHKAFKKDCLPQEKNLRLVAYNVASAAVIEYHKIASRKKIIVTGKTSTNK